MPLTYEVPTAVQKAARRGLKAHRARNGSTPPLRGVTGLNVAEALASGHVPLDLVSKVRRFFAVHEGPYLREVQGLRTEVDSAVVRSWLLHGAEAGQRWSGKAYRKAVREGGLSEDPLTDLFALRPEEIYLRFALGAWRYEYDLTPDKAALFVEEYTLATGLPIDLPQAFGAASPAVGNAIYRRYHTPNPFKEAYKALLVRDTDYRLAANVDLAEMTRSLTDMMPIDESIFPQASLGSPTVIAKKVWASFIAYCILASEKPELIKELNDESLKPPVLGQKIKSFRSYHDAINTSNMYFHPDGKLYADDSEDKKYAGMNIEMMNLVWRTYYEKKLYPNQVQKLLGRARRYLAQQKKAGNLFHIFIADWRKGNWKHILDNIPVAADVRPAFQKFANEHPLPKDGIQLQQTLVDKKLKAEIATTLPDVVMVPVKLNTTAFSKEADKQKTPIGIHSVYVNAANGWQFDIAGAFVKEGGVTVVAAIRQFDKSMQIFKDEFLAEWLEDGTIKIVMGHKDMPGTVYPDPEVPVAKEEKQSGTGTLADFLVSEFGDNASLLFKVNMDDTESYIAALDYLDAGIWPGTVIKHKEKGWTMKLVQAYETVEGNLIVYTLASGEYEWQPDETIAAIIKTGKLTLDVDADPASVDQAATDWVDPKKEVVPGGVWDHIKKSHDADKADVKVLEWNTTALYHAAQAIGATVRTGSKWKFTDEDTIFELVVALDVSGTLITHIVYRAEDVPGVFMNTGDTMLANSVKNGEFVPHSKEAKPAPAGPKFAAKSVVNYKGVRYYIGGYEFATKTYVAGGLLASAGAVPPYTTITHEMEDDFDLVAENVKPTEIGKYISLASWFEFIAIPASWGLEIGDTLSYGGVTLLFHGAAQKRDHPGENYVIVSDWSGKEIAHNASVQVPMVKLIPEETIVAVEESSYAPTDPKPEPGSEEGLDERDADQGDAEMFGTNPALAFVESKDWTPAIKSESTAFQFDLGQKLAYGASKTRTIIGYAFKDDIFAFKDDLTVYIMWTEKGNIGWKTTDKGNAQYGPVIEVVQKIIDSLIPKPGTPKGKFPKLNYRLSKLAKKVAQESDIIYVPSPSNPAFYAGTRLTHKETGKKFRLLGWRAIGDNVIAVLWDFENEDIATALNNELATEFEVSYQFNNLLDPDENTATFGKGAGNEQITVAGPALALPTGKPEGWDDPTPMNQPPMAEIPKGSHVSAGIVAVMPTGTQFQSGDEMWPSTTGLVVMVHPMNGYAGYALTFPKGTVDPGESIEATAVREVWEETGLSVKPVAFLGDYKGKQSTTRFFIGHVTGGHPTEAGKETDAVTFRPLDGNVISEKPGWYAKLTDRDKEIYSDALKWINGNNWPHNVAVDASEDASAVTGPQDVEGETGPPTYDPTTEFTADQLSPNHTTSTIDYKVFAAMQVKIPTMFPPEQYTYWSFAKQLGQVNKGFPPVGAKTTVQASETEYFVRAYVNSQGVMGIFLRYIVLDPGPGTPIQLKLLQKGTEDVLGPGDFAPVAAAVQAKTQTVAADTSKDDLWKTLLFKMPFPISTDGVNALKKEAKINESVPVKFTASKTKLNFVAYGQVFTFAAEPYIALGYVGWIDEKGNAFEYLLAQRPDGNVITMGAGLVVDADATAAATPAEPFFTHPDPDTNKIIQTVYVNGGNLKLAGVPVKKFKFWMKEVGVPSWAVITLNIIQDLCALFVPGAATKAQYDALIGCLKSRMKATHKGKKGKIATTPVDAVSTEDPAPPATMAPTAPVTPDFTAPKKVAKSIKIESPLYMKFINTPEPFLFSDTGKSISGGSKPNKLLLGPGGSQWMFKTGLAGEGDFRSYVDEAGYKLAGLIKKNNVPIAVMEFDGKVGSFQPYADDASTPTSDPTELNEEDMVEVLTQHMVDMFMGDHDGHVGNWIRTGGKLRAVDRGQAFKFLFAGKADSYDPQWHAPGNFGEGYAKRLLIEWGKGTTELPDSAFTEMRKAIGKVQNVVDAELQAILDPVFTARGSSDKEKKKVLNALKKRRDNYLKDWTTVMKKLRTGFSWPAVKISKVKTQIFESSPDEMGLKKREKDDIKKAVASGWQGKALRINSASIEGQEVMVRRVTYEEKPGLKVPATLIHFRVTRPAGLDAVKKLLPKAKVTIEEEGGFGGPTALKVDAANQFYIKILAGIKTVNQHLSKLGDLDINMQTIGTAMELVPVLQGIFTQTKDPAAIYSPTGETNEAVNAMADQYLQYLAAIKLFVDQKQEFLGKHSPTFSPFTWQETDEDEERREKAVAAPVNVELRKQGAVWPQSSATNGDIAISGLNKPVYNSSSQPQFIIKDLNGKATIFWNPPGGAGGLKSGVEGHKSTGWGVMVGEPSPAIVAHMLKLFQSATGIGMKPSTKKDNEALYWARQASLLQKGGSVNPNSDGTIELEQPVIDGMNAYRAGDVDGAISTLREHVAKKLGVKVADLTKQPGYEPELEDTRGAGWSRHKRIGWTRSKLQSKLGKDILIAHSVKGGSSSLLDFFQKAQNNGALLSNNTKPFYGVSINGYSTGSDFEQGGTQGLFLGFRKAFSAGNVLYFDISLMLRTDVYVVGTGDAFGNVKAQRVLDPDRWAQWISSHGASGSIGSSSSYQINARHDIDLQTYLHTALCSSITERDKIRVICKKLGWLKFAQGRPINKVIVTSSEASV